MPNTHASHKPAQHNTGRVGVNTVDFNGVDKVIIEDPITPAALDLASYLPQMETLAVKFQNFELDAIVPLVIAVKPGQVVSVPAMRDMQKGGAMGMGVSSKARNVKSSDCWATWQGRYGGTFTVPKTAQAGEHIYIVGEDFGISGDGAAMFDLNVQKAAGLQDLNVDKVYIGNTEMWPRIVDITWPNFPDIQSGVKYRFTFNYGIDLDFYVTPEEPATHMVFDPPPDTTAPGGGTTVFLWDQHPDNQTVTVTFTAPEPQGIGNWCRVSTNAYNGGQDVPINWYTEANFLTIGVTDANTRYGPFLRTTTANGPDMYVFDDSLSDSEFKRLYSTNLNRNMPRIDIHDNPGTVVFPMVRTHVTSGGTPMDAWLLHDSHQIGDATITALLNDMSSPVNAPAGQWGTQANSQMQFFICRYWPRKQQISDIRPLLVP